MQAGCRRFDSVRLHQTSLRSLWRSLRDLCFCRLRRRAGSTAPDTIDMIRQQHRLLSRPVGRKDLRIHFTSFREIISVVGFIRVWVRWSQDQRQRCPSQVQLTKCSRSDARAGNVRMFLTGSDRRGATKGPRREGPSVFLLPDQVKRDKGVWWMPWQQEAMKDVILCDKPWGAENKL